MKKGYSKMKGRENKNCLRKSEENTTKYRRKETYTVTTLVICAPYNSEILHGLLSSF